MFRIERIASCGCGFCPNDLQGYDRIGAKGIVPRSGRLDAPAFEFGVAGNFAVHIRIDRPVGCFPLGNRIGEEQRSALHVDSLSGNGVHDGLHAETQPNPVAVLEFAPESHERAGGTCVSPQFAVDIYFGIPAPCGNAQQKRDIRPLFQAEGELDLPVERIGGPLCDVALSAVRQVERCSRRSVERSGNRAVFPA